jgi:hypothetical protein
VLLALVLTDPEARDALSYIAGRLLWTTLLLPGLLVGGIAHFSWRRWGRGRFALAVVGAELLSLFISSAAALANAGGGY